MRTVIGGKSQSRIAAIIRLERSSFRWRGSEPVRPDQRLGAVTDRAGLTALSSRSCPSLARSLAAQLDIVAARHHIDDAGHRVDSVAHSSWIHINALYLVLARPQWPNPE